jgi:hypothetical protein
MPQQEKKKAMSEKELLKYEIAKELGLAEKINKYGWGELTAQESGRIGGLMTKRMKSQEISDRI